jgi:NAD(P)-dependent dehydrogenase (short-subunit alcohol dehydrogenase family)
MATSQEVVSAFASQVTGRVFVITGAGHPSIGASMATALAAAGPAHILIASRTAANVEPVLEAVRSASSSSSFSTSVRASFVQIDLSDHVSVRRAADEILAQTGSHIDVLINSAGVMALKQYAVDAQGIEMQMSVNHVGHFLLTNLLVPGLLASGSARVVNLSSAGYQISPVRYEDPAFSSGAAYDPWTAYGQAKAAQILFARGLTGRLFARGLVAVACHPGSNLDTKLGAHVAMDDYAQVAPITKRNTGADFVFSVGDEPRFKTYDQIGATPLIAALDPTLARGDALYVQNNRAEQPAAAHVSSPEHVEKCWKLSEELVGQKFPY